MNKIIKLTPETAQNFAAVVSSNAFAQNANKCFFALFSLLFLGLNTITAQPFATLNAPYPVLNCCDPSAACTTGQWHKTNGTIWQGSNNTTLLMTAAKTVSGGDIALFSTGIFYRMTPQEANNLAGNKLKIHFQAKRSSASITPNLILLWRIGGEANTN